MSSRIPLNPAEEQQVLDALRAFEPRDRCLMIVGLNTGFRASELGAITIGDVWNGSEVRPELTLSRRFLKGGHGVHRRSVRSRTLPLNAAARTALAEYLAIRDKAGALVPTAPLFPSQRKGYSLQRWQVNRIVHRAVAAAGIRNATRIGCHTLRKTFCRKVYAASGHDIHATSLLLGHRHITTTQAYIETNAERLRTVVLSL